MKDEFWWASHIQASKVHPSRFRYILLLSACPQIWCLGMSELWSAPRVTMFFYHMISYLNHWLSSVSPLSMAVVCGRTAEWPGQGRATGDRPSQSTNPHFRICLSDLGCLSSAPASPPPPLTSPPHQTRDRQTKHIPVPFHTDNRWNIYVLAI